MLLYITNNRRANATLVRKPLPSNCADLNDIGHTLNAFYIVRDNATNSSKLQTIYCDFQSLTSSNGQATTSADSIKYLNDVTLTLSLFDLYIIYCNYCMLLVMEKRLGFLDVKSSARGVYFYVQRNSSSVTRGPSLLRYTVQLLNVGGGMNRSTGVFTAPKPGFYHFDFVGVKPDVMGELIINLRVNGLSIGEFFSTTLPVSVPVAIHSTLKLKRGDRVDIFVVKGALMLCTANCIHFTGWLLEEDI